MRLSTPSIAIVTGLLITLSACSWQRIPTLPDYATERPLPLKVGVMVADTAPSQALGTQLIQEWKRMPLFDSITYPYRDGDQVDGVMTLSVNGGWKGSGAGAGVLIGLTLGLAGTVLGPSMTGTHTAEAIMTMNGKEVGRYTGEAQNTVEWGITADGNEVAKKAEELQRRTLANDLAKKIRADYTLLMSSKSR